MRPPARESRQPSGAGRATAGHPAVPRSFCLPVLECQDLAKLERVGGLRGRKKGGGARVHAGPAGLVAVELAPRDVLQVRVGEVIPRGATTPRAGSLGRPAENVELVEGLVHQMGSVATECERSVIVRSSMTRGPGARGPTADATRSTARNGNAALTRGQGRARSRSGASTSRPKTVSGSRRPSHGRDVRARAYSWRGWTAAPDRRPTRGGA
jgi:hypothetical protein